MKPINHSIRRSFALTIVLAGLAGSAYAGQVQRVQHATEADVDDLIKTLKNDPLLTTAVAVQDLANGRIPLSASNFDTFLHMAGYEPRTMAGGGRLIRAPYRTGHSEIRAALDATTRTVSLVVVVRKFLTPSAGLQHLGIARLLYDNGDERRGAFRLDQEGHLMLMLSLDARGLTTVAFDRGVARLLQCANETEDVWGMSHRPVMSRDRN